MSLTVDELCRIVEDFKKPPVTMEAGVPCDALLAAFGIKQSSAIPAPWALEIRYKEYLPANTMVVKEGDEMTVYMLNEEGKPYALRVPPVEDLTRLTFRRTS